ncbi:LOW QUALITY PROTEIN: 5'-nucleotidase-like [Penaeus japonicus]|uniref:LOW QUALITY PROTEIN: 5'-nucleotidase-like n=1 Tax=Penaeus japonicus TaxID=27405 RepID=UPI001C714958|nr:LOW QUALITY PROTEIN: 5'-nucleotidase-like [Penaeus japonicus]
MDSLGNHEFDDGVAGIPFLENASFPVLAANFDDRKEPSVQGKYQKSAVFVRGSRRIGVVGYVTVETMMIANPGKIRVTDEVQAVRKEAQRLKNEGVDIIIALGHAGFKKDMEIAREVEEIDVVVGGHTNTFLYTGGADPSTEPSVGEYPTVVTQASGRKVLVVQAYAFGKYLGHLEVKFDGAGEVTGWNGNPILMDNAVEEDPQILSELLPFQEQVASVVKEEIGKTYVFLDGTRLNCRMKECNLGNLQTDAIVHMNTKYPDDERWARTALAVLNGGGIRASVDERASNGTITMEDILTVAPFQNTIDIVELRGQHVKEMFEYSVQNYDSTGQNLFGGFLQVSGFVVVYDLNLPVGQRVVRLQARCVSCRVPEMQDVKADQIYQIAMPSYLANGGDGYEIIRDNKVEHHLTGLLDTDAFSQYIALNTPIYQGLENRILYINSHDLCPDNAAVSDEKEAHGHPYFAKPHDLMSEMMDRHDEYYKKHFVSPKKKGSSKKTESRKKTEGYFVQEPSQTFNHFSFNFGDRIL